MLTSNRSIDGSDKPLVPTQFLLRSRQWPKSTMHIQSTRYDTIMIQNARVYLSLIVKDPRPIIVKYAWRGGTQIFESIIRFFRAIICPFYAVVYSHKIWHTPTLSSRPHILPRSLRPLMYLASRVSQFLQHSKSEAIAGQKRSYHVMYEQTG